MKRLRHPVRAIREPFGTAGLIVACVALIAALGGTALAAAKLTSTQKKEVEKIAKKFAGKPGAPGAAGPQGPAGKDGTSGKDGTNGAPGEKGDPGANGTNGSDGTDGESPVGTAFTTGAEEEALFGAGQHPCHEVGGVVYETASEEHTVCNGNEGSPWTAGGTLPSGKEEKGTFAFSVSGGDDQGHALAPISFAIPLLGEAGESATFYKEVGGSETEKAGFSTHCGGSASLPVVTSTEYPAKRNTVCLIWEGSGLVNATLQEIRSSAFGNGGFSTVGGSLVFNVTVPGPAHGAGAWVVKAK